MKYFKYIIYFLLTSLFLPSLKSQTLTMKDFLQELYSHAYYSSKISKDSYTLGCVEIGDEVAKDGNYIMEITFNQGRAFFKSDSCSNVLSYELFVKDMGETVFCTYTFVPDSPEGFRYLIEAVKEDIVYVTIYGKNKRGKYKETRRAVFRVIS